MEEMMVSYLGWNTFLFGIMSTFFHCYLPTLPLEYEYLLDPLIKLAVDYDKSFEEDPILREINVMLTYDGNDQGWAVICHGSNDWMKMSSGETVLTKSAIEIFDLDLQSKSEIGPASAIQVRTRTCNLFTDTKSEEADTKLVAEEVDLESRFLG
ncbi:hypothetical protein L2E82_15031 [Cichorium intybus]|uniref:Uncharacterized protein n=1 Tax=Cichorium intybus TaxID=13427 RepID=A0ACB9F2U7_CICIN|nr:hypothetical protein L2E82_15031 [Cichorium intybus]